MKTLYETAAPNPAGHRDVKPAQVLANQAGARIIDVREPHEFTGDLGHIHGAELVPLATVQQHLGAWSKSEPVVLICRSGRRSEIAANKLVAAGFREVMNMVGGMLAWSEEHLPVEGAHA